MMMYLGFAISPFAPAPLINEFGRATTLTMWGGALVVIAVFALVIKQTSGRQSPSIASQDQS